MSVRSPMIAKVPYPDEVGFNSAAHNPRASKPVWTILSPSSLINRPAARSIRLDIAAPARAVWPRRYIAIFKEITNDAYNKRIQAWPLCVNLSRTGIFLFLVWRVLQWKL